MAGQTTIMFKIIRKTARMKPETHKLMQARTLAIVYKPMEALGFRYRVRNIQVVESWNKGLKNSGILNFPLSQTQRMHGHLKRDSPDEPFLVFATLRKILF